MKLEIDVSLTYALGAERTALLALQAAREQGQVVVEDKLDIDDAELSFMDGEWGMGQRCWARLSSEIMRLTYRATVGVSRQPERLDGLPAVPLHELPTEQVTFLRPSRFCQSDQFETFAEREFGQHSGGEKIMAMMHWIAEKMAYDPVHSHSETTLLETFATRKGVCRDYAHLLCGLARASHIPARYVAAYGASVDPPDFHAVVQVWLDNQWHLVDPTGMCSADELVLIGVGRDAADVPFMETPDAAQFMDQKVRVDIS